jgi:hypothetical protein
MSLTNQEAFDKVVVHLSTMPRKSTASDGNSSEQFAGCVYRTPDGNRCAIGALIPDELYEERMDLKGLSVDWLIKEYPHIKELFKDCSHSLLAVLQSIHDDNRNIHWEDNKFIGWNELKEVAEAFRLNTEVIDNIMGDKSL